MCVVICRYLFLYQNKLICNADYAGKVDVPLDDVHQRICNGFPAADCQFLWQVAILIPAGNNSFYFCGTSLISRKWVLTAAHCVYG